jgi:hypothetical protein
MNVIPHTRQEWFRFLLFPFKAFVVTSPIFLFVWIAVTEGYRVRGSRAEAAVPVGLGLILCVPIFVLVGLIQLIARRRDSAVTSFGFALAAFLLLYLWVLPMCVT